MQFLRRLKCPHKDVRFNRLTSYSNRQACRKCGSWELGPQAFLVCQALFLSFAQKSAQIWREFPTFDGHISVLNVKWLKLTQIDKHFTELYAFSLAHLMVPRHFCLLCRPANHNYWTEDWPGPVMGEDLNPSRGFWTWFPKYSMWSPPIDPGIEFD